MKPARAGNAMVDGLAVGPEGERIAIEVKSPRDDVIRGIGQCYEAVCAGYNRAVLVTTLRVARKLRKVKTIVATIMMIMEYFSPFWDLFDPELSYLLRRTGQIPRKLGLREDTKRTQV